MTQIIHYWYATAPKNIGLDQVSNICSAEGCIGTLPTAQRSHIIYIEVDQVSSPLICLKVGWDAQIHLSTDIDS